MRRPLVAANWKMNGSIAMVDGLLGALLDGLSDARTIELVICPPSLYIGQARQKLAGSCLQLGVQNVFVHGSGAYTGEISAQMVAEFECTHAIVGHSERREIFGETDELVADKFTACRQQGLTPILCVGETLAQREAGISGQVILDQLEAVLAGSGIESFARAVIAYEPVWAIGSGLSASPEQAQEVHALIRSRLSGLDESIAAQVQILYGGSVKAANAAALLRQADIDGALVGGASLNAEEFIAICSQLTT